MRIILTWSEVTVSQPQSLTETLPPERTCESTQRIQKLCSLTKTHSQIKRNYIWNNRTVCVRPCLHTMPSQCRSSSQHTLPLHWAHSRRDVTLHTNVMAKILLRVIKSIMPLRRMGEQMYSSSLWQWLGWAVSFTPQPLYYWREAISGKTGLEFGGSRSGLGALENRKSYCCVGNRNRIARSFVQATN